jgi:tetratricopeptide (TPR) repeat protein
MNFKLYQSGKFAEAIPLAQQTLVTWEKQFGPDHVNVATALNKLAVLYYARGRYADAEPLYKRSLAIREEALGPDHPDVAQSLNNLAALYANLGRYPDAEALLKRSVAIREKALGPDHPDIALSLMNLAKLHSDQGQYADAEPLYKRSLAIYEKAPGQPYEALALNNVLALYRDQHRYDEALPLVRAAVVGRFFANTDAALAVLFGAEAGGLIRTEEAFDDSLSVVQRATYTSAAEALSSLAVRFSAGNDRLAQLVRKDQDLTAEAGNLDKAIIAAVAKEPSQRDADAEQSIKDRIDAVANERHDLKTIFARDFPDYAALSHPLPLSAKDIQPLLAEDEALVVVALGVKSYVWVVTNSETAWKEIGVTASQVAKTVSTLRELLKVDNDEPFDTELSFELYRRVLGPIDGILRPKPRLSFVLNGALTSLPPQVLITRDPAGKALKDVNWLIRSHAVTVMPSVASLKVLREKPPRQAPRNR